MFGVSQYRLQNLDKNAFFCFTGEKEEFVLENLGGDKVYFVC